MLVKSRSGLFLSPPLEGIVHLCYVRLCWRGEDFVCISPCTSIPVAIATAMGDQVSFFISSPWVLAWRPIKLVGSRRCEVWLSAGGGEEDWQLWWDWKLVLAHCFLFNVDTTQWLCSLSCIFTHPTLLFSVTFSSFICITNVFWRGNHNTQTSRRH